MKDIPITFKNVATSMMFVVMAAGFTTLYIYNINIFEGEPVEEIIEQKYSKKGLYLYPRFEIVVSNSDQPSRVTREQFESIQIGDQISGIRRGETFLTSKDIQFEKRVSIPIFIFLYFGVFAYGGGLLREIKFIKGNQTLLNLLNRILRMLKAIVLATYISIGAYFVTMTATNAFNKLNKINQTEVIATLLDRDLLEIRTQRGASYTTYELFLGYQDQEGNDYVTKKAVTRPTYYKYAFKESMPLTYRNNNMYDTFVSVEGTDEVLPAYFNLYTIFMGLYIFSLLIMFKAWRNKKNNKKEPENIVDQHR